MDLNMETGYASFLYWRTPLQSQDQWELPDAEDDDDQGDLNDQITGDGDGDGDAGEEAGRDHRGDERSRSPAGGCYADLGIAEFILRPPITFLQQQLNEPLKPHAAPQRDLSLTSRPQSKTAARLQPSVRDAFNDYHFWKSPMSEDLDLPDVEDYESSEGSEEGSEQEEDDDDNDGEDDEDEEIRRFMEKTIADVVLNGDSSSELKGASESRSSPSVASSYSQQELDMLDRDSRRLDVFMIFFRDYAKKYEDLVSSTRERLEAIGEASHAVLTSEKLPVLFGVVVTLSNRLKQQEGLPASGSQFKIAELEQILSKKSTSGDTSLLHYVVHVLEKNFSKTPALGEELAKVEEAKEASLEEARQELVTLKKGMAAITSEIEYQCKAPEDDYDLRIREMKGFVGDSQSELEDLEEEAEQVSKVYQRTLSFLGEDPATESTEFFSHLHSLLQSIKRAEDENRATKQFDK